MANDAITETWNKVKTIVESMDLDIQKNAGGNASAGVRARRGLRLLKPNLTAIRHATSGDNNEVCTQRDHLSPVDRLNLQIDTISAFDERALFDAMSNVDRNAALRSKDNNHHRKGGSASSKTMLIDSHAK